MLKDFKRVIRECDYSNTYKMAWAKAIVELANNYFNNALEITALPLKEIAEKMFKYYWDQTIYFNLFQSSPNQPPVILTEVKKIITLYKEEVEEFKPIVFERAFMNLNDKIKKEYTKSIRRCITNIKTNVMPFFLNLNSLKFDFYKIDFTNNLILINTKFLCELKTNQEDLFDLINYRWSLMLENYNSCPRIGKKVRIMDEQVIERKSLKLFDEFLDLENKNHNCFICGKEIYNEDLSRDHVIPWSYMYSDDLWNIVYVHKGCNSSKSDRVPSIEAIDKLKERNQQLHMLLQEKYGDKKIKLLQEFEYAIENNFVDKFYLGCKGC